MTNFWAELFIVLTAEATLLIIATAIIQRYATSAAWRRTMWQACFVGLMVLLLCELAGARWTAVGLFHRGEPTLVSSSSTPVSVAPPVIVREAPQIFAQSELASTTPIANAKSKLENRQGWPGFVWAAGIVVFAVLGISRRALLVGFRARCNDVTDASVLAQIGMLAGQLGIKRRIRVIACGRLVSPIAFGSLRPTICLPMNFAELFTAPEQEAVLLHELAHIAARDSVWQLLTDAVVAVFWWHPLVWWAQCELRNSTEAAADEASALVANGPKVLAECLVNLGTRFTDSAGFKALGIHGVRFRSNLGRRVQRLFTLSTRGSTELAPPAAWRSRLTQFCAPTVCVAAIVACGAWATASTKGDNMKTWKQSLAGLAAVSLLQTIQAAPVEPGTKPNDLITVTASKPPKGSDGTTSTLSKPKEASKTEPASLRNLTELNQTSKNTQLVRRKLETIVLDTVTYDGLPLGEVIKSLMEESRRRDPEKRGINFIFGKPRFVLHAAIDPATGLPVKGVQESFNIQDTTIRIVPPVNNIRLIDALEVIRRVADHPIEYTIHEYGVVFAEAPAPGSAVIVEPEVFTMALTFKVDPANFFAAIKRTFGIDIDTRSPEEVRTGLAQFLAALGIDIYSPNRAVFYNQLNGMLLIRATREEMGLVQAAMDTLGATTAQPAK